VLTVDVFNAHGGCELMVVVDSVVLIN